MVGLLAETPPEGFGFSDTAFRIFILMASRRLQSDRFLTVPDPRLRVLRDTPRLFRAIRIRLTGPA